MLGQRVVRGPDWKWAGQDGGEGRVGTIVEVGDQRGGGDSPLSSPIPEKTVIVQWDGATRTNYRIGHGDAYDLRLYDSAPAGAKHAHVICDICRVQPIRGIRWKCQRCYDFDLCSQCYHAGKHNTNHEFWCIDVEDGARIEVGPRTSSTRIKASGFFPGAKVTRGADWEWGNQDGGIGQAGRVTDVRGWGSESDRSVVTVRWPNGTTNVYRVGHRGKVDLKCIEAGEGGTYYRDHLPVLGRPRPKSSTIETKMRTAMTSSSPPPPPSSDGNAGLKSGDLVSVNLEADLLRLLQEGHGGWNAKMEEVIGKPGEVHRVTERGDVRVKYVIDGAETIWMFHPGALSKVVGKRLEVGDRVKILDDVVEVKRLQEGHGDWADDMVYSLGMVGEVVKIYGDGDIRVAVNGSTWTYNVECVAKTTEPISAVTAPKGAGSDSDDLRDMLAELLFDHVGGNPSALVQHAAEGNLDRVKLILAKKRDAVNIKVQGRTALQLACHQGHTEIVTALVDSGADLEMTDPDGDSALHFSCFGDEPDTAEILLKRGANVNALNKTGSTPMHVAVNKNQVGCVRVLIMHKADLNCQDAYGDTPLHDSIAKDNIAVLDMLLEAKADPRTRNYRGFNALHHAALKGNNDSVQRLLKRHPALVNEKKEDGFTALHLASLNDHKDVARTLLRERDCDVNARNNRRQTPLLLAVAQGHTKLIEILVGYGADVDASDEDGDTGLHIALMRHNVSKGSSGALHSLADDLRSALGAESMGSGTGIAIACFLAQEGATLTIKNRRGKTAFDLCSDLTAQDMVRQYSRTKSEAAYRGSLKATQSGGSKVHRLIKTASEPDELDPKPVPRRRRDVTQSMSSMPEMRLSVSPKRTFLVGDTCLSCDKKPNVKFSPCGHTNMCSDCAVGLKRCVECKGVIDSKEKEEEEVMCQLCDDERAVVVFEPCMHVIMCVACSRRSKKCLECKVKITRKLINGKDIDSASGGDAEGECAICMERPLTIVFLCGHRACNECAYRLKECHICREPIEKRIQIFT